MSFLLSSGLRTAIPDGLVDNFEPADGDPAGPYESGENLSTYYSGDLGNFSRSQTTEALDGDYAFDFDSGSPGEAFSFPGDGLPTYPVKGDVFAGLLQADGGRYHGIGFGFGDTENWYDARINDSDNEIGIGKVYGGSFTQITSVSTTIGSGTWYDVEIEWHDGSGSEPDDTIIVRLYTVDSSGSRTGEQASVSTQDATHATNDGIGWTVGAGGATGFGDKLRRVGTV